MDVIDDLRNALAGSSNIVIKKIKVNCFDWGGEPFLSFFRLPEISRYAIKRNGRARDTVRDT